VLSNYGVQVTIVEFLDRLLPLEDADVSKELGRRYRKYGIEVLTSTKVESISEDGGVTVTVAGKDGKSKELKADKLLQAIGFAPRVKGYGLENTGVELTDRGAIAIDERMRTNVPHVYAIGDVTAKLMLAHVGEAQGVVAAETIAGAETMELEYVMMPRATFCNPQVASFGYTEAQARELADQRGWKIKVAQFPWTANGKAQGLGEANGFVKLIGDETYGELLGGHLIGPEVTELLPELTLAQRWDLTANELARNVHAHPTLSEGLQEAFHGLLHGMINL
jgi:dihydrolipoamide dehydrogenase